MKHFFKYCVFCFIALMFICCQNKANEKSENNNNLKDSNWVKITSKVIEVENGWGFEIYADDKKFIKQDIIPGIPGINPFKSPEDADKTAKLMISKMMNNIFPPSISEKELDSLGVIKK